MVLEIITDFFTNFSASVPEEYKIIVSLLFYTFFIVIYAVFIWKFYRFLASREILQLNLKQYNSTSYPGLEKILAIILYTIEYIVILPFLVLFWFTILSLFLLILSEAQSVEQILLVSAAIIASTRIASYIGEDLSKDLAKILPFTILALFILGHSFFNVQTLIDRFSQITTLFNNILIFVIFIFIIELILRGLYSVSLFFDSSSKILSDSEKK